MNEYALIKVIHIGALILWLGPALGAWFVFRYVEKGEYHSDQVTQKVSKIFFLTIVLEHLSFVVLLTSGFVLAIKYQWFGSGWLEQKLLIVFVLIIPLEIMDVLLGNWIATQASKKMYLGQALKPWERKGLEIYHGVFTKLALLVMPISVLIIMYLAVSKQVLW